MDRQGPPNQPISLLGVLLGLDNKKDAMMAHCLDRKEVWCTTWQMQLFLSFGGGGSALTWLPSVHLIKFAFKKF